MNEHILLVMKWINDPDSVSVKDLWDNRERADSSYYNAKSIFHDSANYAYKASFNALHGYLDDAENRVDDYFKETGEDKLDYLKALSVKPLPQSVKPLPQFKASILSSRPITVYNEARKGPVIVQRCSTNGDVQEEYVVISRKLWDKGVK